MSELRLERSFSAEVETVFAYITKTEHLLTWWGPEGMTVPEHDMDFTKTGPWSSVMMNDKGDRYKVSGEVLKIDAPNTVELTWAWHDENDQRGNESRVRFEVAPNGSGGSTFALIHSGLPDDEAAEDHTQGWTSSLRKLERLAT